MNSGGTNWQAEAQFWKQKYAEQMINHAQVVAALMRPTMPEMPVMGTESMPVPTEEEKPTETPQRNGAKTGARS